MRAVRVELGGKGIVEDISITIRQGEFVTLVGASGSGKTTLLRAIAGLVPCAAGSVQFMGRQVTAPDPRVAFVFQ
ncbi:MAG TPA: ATP-binding cassette domain-containing protein, partial [Ramlibacter sp.]|nr:ATP-binding cassette domain-containing protein [Ramlibacter sp.]